MGLSTGRVDNVADGSVLQPMGTLDHFVFTLSKSLNEKWKSA